MGEQHKCPTWEQPHQRQGPDGLNSDDSEEVPLARTAGGGRTGRDCEGCRVVRSLRAHKVRGPQCHRPPWTPALHRAAVNARDTEADDRERRLLKLPTLVLGGGEGGTSGRSGGANKGVNAPAAWKAPQCPPWCPLPGGDAGQGACLGPQTPPGLGSAPDRVRSSDARPEALSRGILTNKQGPRSRRCTLVTVTEGSGRRGAAHAGLDPEALGREQRRLGR